MKDPSLVKDDYFKSFRLCSYFFGKSSLQSSTRKEMLWLYKQNYGCGSHIAFWYTNHTMYVATISYGRDVFINIYIYIYMVVLTILFSPYSTIVGSLRVMAFTSYFSRYGAILTA